MQYIRNEVPAKDLDSYLFSRDRSIIDRVNHSDRIVLDYLMNMDGDYSYTYYELSEEEKTLLTQYISLLPEGYIEILRKKLIGIYFINNFLGSGLADYAFSDSGDLYYILILNPMIFQMSLSELFTYKEKTCFNFTNSDLDLKIDISDDYSGLLYILMHESSHILDYEDRITPFTEPHLKDLIPPKDNSSPFTDKFWIDYFEMKEFLQLKYRDQIHFYSDDGGKKIPADEIIQVYRELQTTPFTSLYSYFSWAEDFAEYATLHHFTQNLSMEYRISITEKGREIFRYKPFDNKTVSSRELLLKTQRNL